MKILLLAGQTAGLIGFLTLAERHPDVVAYSEDVFTVADHNRERSQMVVRAPIDFNPIYDERYDLIVSVHGRQIVPQTWLDKTPGINLHPCLWKYKGKNPVGRAIAAGETKFSVGAHRMTDKVDEGEVLVEKFVRIPGGTDLGIFKEDIMLRVYQRLYPLYSMVLMEALEKCRV